MVGFWFLVFGFWLDLHDHVNWLTAKIKRRRFAPNSVTKVAQRKPKTRNLEPETAP